MSAEERTVSSNRLENASAFKRQAYYALENPRHGGVAARVFCVVLFVLIVLNAASVFVSGLGDLPSVALYGLAAFSVVSTLCFALEYAARLWVADIRYPHLSPGRARVRYAFSVMGIIDFLAFVPVVIAWLVPLTQAVINGIYIMRLVRLVKISRYMRGLRALSRVLEKRRSEIAAAFMMLALLTVTASVLMYEVENPVQPEIFDSVFTGMYWAMTTITSTGYGDLVPITPLGRFIGFCTMMLSIGVVAIPAGIFSAGFVEEFRTQDTERRRLRQNKPLDGDNACDGYGGGDAYDERDGQSERGVYDKRDERDEAGTFERDGDLNKDTRP